MWPLPVVRRVGQSYKQIECGGYVRCSKNSLTTINGKVQRSRITVSPGSHSLVEFDYRTRVVELVWSHKGFKGVALQKPYGASKLRGGGGGQTPECHKSAHCAGPCHCSQNYL